MIPVPIVGPIVRDFERLGIIGRSPSIFTGWVADLGRVLLSVLGTISLVVLGAVLAIAGTLRLVGVSPTDVVPIGKIAGAAGKAIRG